MRNLALVVKKKIPNMENFKDVGCSLSIISWN